MYIIGNVMNILQNLCPATNEYKQTMDNLNRYMGDHNFEDKLKFRLRDYFRQCRSL